MAKRTYPAGDDDHRYAQMELTDHEFDLFLGSVRKLNENEARQADQNGFIFIQKMFENQNLFDWMGIPDSEYAGVCRESCLARMKIHAMRNFPRKSKG